MRTRLSFAVLFVTFAVYTAPVRADAPPQLTVSIDGQKASLQVDGDVPLWCMTVTIDALNKLGHDETIVTEVSSLKQTRTPKGIEFVATIENDTLTLSSERPIPLNTLIVFLEHLRAAPVSDIAFGAARGKQVMKNDKPSDAPRPSKD